MADANERINTIERDLAETVRIQQREMDRKWGDLANKLGTVVEDIIAPGLPGVLRSCFGVDPDEIYVRYRIRHPRTRDRVREFDIVAVGGT